jgi:hypothetical protein
VSTIPFPPPPFVHDSTAPSSPPELSLPFPEPPRVQGLLGPGSEGYRLWRAVARVRGRTGWAQMGVAADDSQAPVSAAFVKLEAGRSKLLVRFRAIRQGAHPQFPNPVPLSPNLKLLAWEDQETASILDGVNLIYHAWGRRLYGCVKPIFGPVDGLVVLAPPWLAGANLNVPASAFSQQIV